MSQSAFDLRLKNIKSGAPASGGSGDWPDYVSPPSERGNPGGKGAPPPPKIIKPFGRLSQRMKKKPSQVGMA